MSLFVFLLWVLNINCSFGWLNFTYKPQSVLNPKYYFQYYVCIDSSDTYIKYVYQYLGSESNPSAKSHLDVAFGTTIPHRGGLAPDRYGYGEPHTDESLFGADAIVWGTYNADGVPYMLEYELNEGVSTELKGTQLQECSGNVDSTCAELISATYDDVSALVTIHRTNIAGNPNNTYQFDESVSHILTQWAFNGEWNKYWYTWEHGHSTRGTYVHTFASQTVSNRKIWPKTAMIDITTGNAWDVFLAMEMNSITGKVTIELWGPNNKWFAVGWGGHSAGDALIYTNGDPNTFPAGSLSLHDYAIYGFELDFTEGEGIYPDSAFGGNDTWTILESIDDGSQAYFKAERDLISPDVPTGNHTRKDIDFNINDDSMIFFGARNGGAGLDLVYHESHYWITEVTFTKEGNIQGTQTWMDAQISNNMNVDCEPEWPATSNPTQNPTITPTLPTISPQPTEATTQPSKSPSKSPSGKPTQPDTTESEFEGDGGDATSLLIVDFRIIGGLIVLYINL